jgi:hypothetical protein
MLMKKTTLAKQMFLENNLDWLTDVLAKYDDGMTYSVSASSIRGSCKVRIESYTGRGAADYYAHDYDMPDFTLRIYIKNGIICAPGEYNV